MEYEALQQPSLEIKSANKQKIDEWRNKERFPEYVLRHLDGMSVNSSQRLHQSCCLLYLSYMMKMYGLTASDWKKKGKQANRKWFGACLNRCLSPRDLFGFYQLTQPSLCLLEGRLSTSGRNLMVLFEQSSLLPAM